MVPLKYKKMLQILVYSTIAYETPSESGGEFFVEIFRGIEVSLKNPN